VSTKVNMRKCWFWFVALAIFALPAVAMVFTSEVRWDIADFVIFGAILMAACMAYETARALIESRKMLGIAAMIIVSAFIVVWAQLAVGIVSLG